MTDELKASETDGQANGTPSATSDGNASLNTARPASTAPPKDDGKNGSGFSPQDEADNALSLDPELEDADGNGAGRNGRGPGRAGPGGYRGGRRWNGRDLTEGSIPRNLFAQAWPQSVEGVLRVVQQMLDLVWAGFLGTTSIAGVGVAQNYTQLAWTARQGVDTAQRAMVSRAIGMRNIPLAELTVFQSVTITAVFSVITGALGIIFAEQMMRLLGVPENVIDKAAPYMRVQFIGNAALSFQQLFASALIASGEPMTPMKTQVVSRVLQTILSPILVFGPIGLPAMGIAGAAAAAAISNMVALSINAQALFSGRSRLHLQFSEYRLDFALIRQMMKIGVPAAVNGAERSISQLILLGLVSPFGDTSLAAFTLTRRFEMFSNLGSQGFGQASGVIVGQNLGAGKPSRAKQTVLWAVAYVTIVQLVINALIFTFPHFFLSIFTRNAQLISVATTWLRIQRVGNIALGSSQVFMQSFMTAGATFFVMIVVLITIWGVQQPLAQYLSHNTSLGQYGIAWAVSLAAVARLVFFIPYYLSGRWLRSKVFADQALSPEAAVSG